jgi:hypothetical protein
MLRSDVYNLSMLRCPVAAAPDRLSSWCDVSAALERDARVYTKTVE